MILQIIGAWIGAAICHFVFGVSADMAIGIAAGMTGNMIFTRMQA
ncbi:MAG: hypothetical protein ACRCT6_11430 [Notoacmeibacter sp.]